jgi:thiol-disulfide isomerase/thioredoxin
MMTKDPALTAKAKALAQAVLASSADPEDKLRVDVRLVMLMIRLEGSATKAAGEAEKPILEFTQRYAKTPLAPEALAAGAVLAEAAEQVKLAEKLQETLLKDYPDSGPARRILRDLGKSADVGKPFTAELVKLDGGKLKLPDDLKGKVVVIDFWATWCGPCLAVLPDMKELYGKYKSKGVEFVGISLDDDKAALDEFLKTAGIEWLIAYTGKGLKDPTVKAYGINAIPSVWVVGKDGNVVSDNTHPRGNLRDLLEKALGGEPATRPAEK